MQWSVIMYSLCDTYNMSAKESVAYFYIRGHNITQRTTMHTFAHWVEIISRNFREVLVTLVPMAIDMFATDLRSLMKVHPKFESNKYYWPYFKIFIVVIGGTRISVMMFRRDQRIYWEYVRGYTSMDIYYLHMFML